MQLNVCKMVRSRKKGFTRRSDYAKVRVKADATYQEVAESSVLQLQSLESSSSDEDDWSGEAVLLRANGAVIVNRPIETSFSTVPWDIESYMKSFSEDWISCETWSWVCGQGKQNQMCIRHY